MKLLAALSICSLFFLLAEGGIPQPCSSPSLLEGKISIVHWGKMYYEWGNFSYDAIGKRIFLDRLIMPGTKKQIHVEDILLYNESALYQFYPDNRTCVKYPLRLPFQKFVIPPNATFAGQLYFGGSEPGQGLLVNTWTGDIGSGHYFVMVTEFGCLPVSETYTRETGWVTETFFDITRGLSDPNVFIPPPECSQLN